MRYRIIIVITLLIISVTIFSRCFRHSAVTGNDPRGPLYAGAESCAGCHKNIADSCMHGNHYSTSSQADQKLLTQWITPSVADFYFTDSSYIKLEKKDNAFFQSYFADGTQTVSYPFDIAFGSGEKAQTFAYWKEDKLYELPLTYFKGINGWANSPGFPASHARYDRVIESRCFQCHASYVNREITQSGALAVAEKLDKESIIFGIDCERCHGPAAEHVEFHTDHPGEKKGTHITSIQSLSRQRQLDLCGTCHSGNDQSPQRDLFAFRPGDTLSEYYFPSFGSMSEPDVHGKQLQLLQSSKCFQLSAMTCSTCHSGHESGTDKTAIFISKCMDCHQQSGHARTMLQANRMTKQNCIDCHMPAQPSKAIYFNTGADFKTIPYFLTTHRIGVYVSP